MERQGFLGLNLGHLVLSHLNLGHLVLNLEVFLRHSAEALAVLPVEVLVASPVAAGSVA